MHIYEKFYIIILYVENVGRYADRKFFATLKGSMAAVSMLTVRLVLGISQSHQKV